MNVVTLIGRLTKDPEIKVSNNGKKYVRFSLAVRRYGDITDFINCIAWEKTAELIANYTAKGRRLAVQGSLNVSSYQVDGETRWSTDVVVNTLEFLDSSNQENSGSNNHFKEESNAFDNLDSDDEDRDFPF